MKSGKRLIGPHVVFLLSVLCSVKAHAITIDFTVNQETALGAYAAGGYGGYFSFDESLVTPGTTLGINTSPETGPAFLGLPTFDLEFNWFGQTWDESNSGLGRLTFDGSGQLTNWLFGGSANTCPPPYDRTAAALGCVSGFATVPDYFVSSGVAAAVIPSVGISPSVPTAPNTVTWAVRSVSVPEPGTWLLMLGALGMFAIARRRPGQWYRADRPAKL